jgi:CheY-like chemotaxis protein/anti-sigma regulatory factor (Ser/Thr protein kinase)
MACERGLFLRVVDCQLAVRSDPHLLRRILQNLLSNALRYTPKETLKGRILLGCRRRGGDLRIEVWDTGVGIAAADQKRIFEEFQRLAPGPEKGLGLGLAIVDRVSRLLGHPVDVHSRPGHGSCFAVTVPLAQGPGTPLQRKSAIAAPDVTERALTILCLDNDATILDGLRALLGGWGHRVLVATDAAGAMAAAEQSPPDVVLVDYHLDGERTGLDFLDDLRQRSGRGICALVVTADRSEAVRTATKARGCELLSKPVKPAALRRFLGGEALSRQFGTKQGVSSV